MILTGVATRCVDFVLYTASFANAASITFTQKGTAHIASSSANILVSNGANINFYITADAGVHWAQVTGAAGPTSLNQFLMSQYTKITNNTGGAVTQTAITGWYFT